MPVLLMALYCFGFKPNAPDKGLLAAMNSELRRSMDSLKLKGEEGPYFLSYLLWDIQSWRVEAAQGSIEKAVGEPSRFINVDLRLGTYERDQSMYEGGVVFGPRLRAPIPEGNDTLLLRQAFWAQTDARYKVALEQLAQKKSFLAGHHGMDRLPDWSRQKVLQQQSIDSLLPPDTAAWIALARKLSASLAQSKWLAESRVAYQYYYVTFYYVDSEGATYIQSQQEHTLLAALLCQAEDGAPLWEYLRLAARDSLSGGGRSGATGFESLRDSLAALVQRLDGLRKSQPVGFYRGPVLFAGSAAGEILKRALLEPQARLREPLSENSEPPFLFSLQGRKYFPDGFTVRDTPGLRRHGDHSLFGAYRFDQEGQPAGDVTLIDHGRLVDFYRGKLPLQEGTSPGNGHWRYGGGFPGVVKVEVEHGIPEKMLLDSLRNRTRDEGASFGLLVSKFADEDAYNLLRHPLVQSIPLGESGGSRGSFSLPYPLALDAVEAETGKRTPIRGLSFHALDSKSLRAIAAAGDSLHLLEPQAAFSLLCPSLLFGLLDLGGSRQVQPRLPLLP